MAKENEDSSLYQSLLEMGFEKSICLKALKHCKHDLNTCVAFIISQQNTHKKNTDGDDNHHNKVVTTSKHKENIKRWKCTTCSTLNSSNHNNTSCTNCRYLDSDINLYRAKALYILGNINKISSSLIPLKTSFFIYPLAPPMLSLTTTTKSDGAWLHFEIDLYDSKQIEKYQIEEIKLNLYKSGCLNSTTFLRSITPYYNKFKQFIQAPYHGSWSAAVYAKCFNSNRPSPPRFHFFKLKQINTKRKKKERTAPAHSKATTIKKGNTNIKTQLLLVNKLKARVFQYHTIITKGCGYSRCTNPYCKSNKQNKNKHYTAAETSKLALKLVKIKHKKCKCFEPRVRASSISTTNSKHSVSITKERNIKNKYKTATAINKYKKQLKRKALTQTQTKNDRQKSHIKSNCKVLSKCLLLSINIADYACPKSYRHGSGMDIKNIENTFGKNGYSYTIIKNEAKTVDYTAFLRLKTKAKTELLTNGYKYDGFMFIFGGHGCASPENQYASALCLSPDTKHGQKYGELILVKDILDEFRNGNKGLGSSFLGKPRIYIFQACRGHDVAESIRKNNKNKMVNEACDSNAYRPRKANIKYHPDDDMIMLQSNTHGYVSYRNVKSGSHLITAVTQVLGNNRDTLSFDDAVYAIKQKVKTLSQSKQACVTTSTLSNKIYLKKKVL